MPTPPDDPPDSSSVGAAVADASDAEAPPESGLRPRNVREALVHFLGSSKKSEGPAFVRGVVVRSMYGDNPEDAEEQLVDEIAGGALARAFKAKWPPLTVGGIPAWVARVTRCEIADYWRENEKDKARIDRGVDASALADRRAAGTDYGARQYLLMKWLARQLRNNPVELETYRLMYLHNVAGFSLEELAAEYHTTPIALAMRFHKLRKKLAPKIKLMDRELPRRAIIIFLFGAGVAVLVAIFALVVWPLLRPAPQPHAPPIPATPVPSASASAGPAPSFDQAVPTDDDSVPSDAGTRKQQGRQK
jgi:hypothetical protein